MNPSQLRASLAHFTGSETFTRHGLARSVLMTKGVVFLAEQAGAHWLTDAISSYIHDERARQEDIQVWHLVVDASTRSATLTMTDGNSNKPIIVQKIEYTDFLLDEITLCLISDGLYRALMLPSDY